MKGLTLCLCSMNPLIYIIAFWQATFYCDLLIGKAVEINFLPLEEMKFLWPNDPCNIEWLSLLIEDFFQMSFSFFWFMYIGCILDFSWPMLAPMSITAMFGSSLSSSWNKWTICSSQIPPSLIVPETKRSSFGLLIHIHGDGLVAMVRHS